MEIVFLKFHLRQTSTLPRSHRVDAKGGVTPEWRAKRDKFIAEMDAYLDASAPGALASLTDIDGEDSDFKWLEVVRGICPGVDPMGGIDRAHLERQRERKRREEMRKLQRQKAEEEMKVKLNR